MNLLRYNKSGHVNIPFRFSSKTAASGSQSARRRTMSLSFVRLSTDAMLSCTTHALSTESQEVMGLLLGRWVDEDDAAGAEVTHVIVLTRTDKRKDRVEVGYAQLRERGGERRDDRPARRAAVLRDRLVPLASAHHRSAVTWTCRPRDSTRRWTNASSD